MERFSLIRINNNDKKNNHNDKHDSVDICKTLRNQSEKLKGKLSKLQDKFDKKKKRTLNL